jgi:enterochelin esterase-like enzyme
VLDVMRDVDYRFATIRARRERVIAGFSAGADRATNIALHNLGVFTNLQAWPGYYLETRTACSGRNSDAACPQQPAGLRSETWTCARGRSAAGVAVHRARR